MHLYSFDNPIDNLRLKIERKFFDNVRIYIHYDKKRHNVIF